MSESLTLPLHLQFEYLKVKDAIKNITRDELEELYLELYKLYYSKNELLKTLLTGEVRSEFFKQEQ